MSPKISFAPGVMQSLQAASYFNGVIAKTLEPWMMGWTPHRYIVDLGEGPRLLWRVWSDTEWTEEELQLRFVRFLPLHEDLELIAEGMRNEGEVARILSSWYGMRQGPGSFLLEVALLTGPRSEGQETRLVVAVLNGAIQMVSTDLLLYTRLEHGLHGLAVAGEGSYLVEESEEDPDLWPLRLAS